MRRTPTLRVILFASLLSPLGCRTASPAGSGLRDDSSSSTSDALGVKTIKDPDARAVMQALADAGVTMPQTNPPMLGASVLKADKIHCSQAVVPHPVPSCEIAANGETFQATPDGAALLFRVLNANGGMIPFDPQHPSVGATNLEATAVTCSAPVVPNAQTTCHMTTAGAATGGTTGGTKKTINNPDAKTFMAALASAGVTMPQSNPPVLGSTVLKADKIRCSQAVVPNPVPSCTISANGQSIPATAAGAKSLFQILNKNGALIPFDPQHPSVGASNVEATAVTCARPVVPNPPTTCTFLVGGT